MCAVSRRARKQLVDRVEHHRALKRRENSNLALSLKVHPRLAPRHVLSDRHLASRTSLPGATHLPERTGGPIHSLLGTVPHKTHQAFLHVSSEYHPLHTQGLGPTCPVQDPLQSPVPSRPPWWVLAILYLYSSHQFFATSFLSQP